MITRGSGASPARATRIVALQVRIENEIRDAMDGLRPCDWISVRAPAKLVQRLASEARRVRGWEIETYTSVTGESVIKRMA